MWFKKKYLSTNETVPAKTCVQLWYVRWTSRNGVYSGDMHGEMEAFTSETEATTFKVSLENAFRLLKHTGSSTRVTMEKAD